MIKHSNQLTPATFKKIVEPKTRLIWIEKKLPDRRRVKSNQDYERGRALRFAQFFVAIASGFKYLMKGAGLCDLRNFLLQLLPDLNILCSYLKIVLVRGAVHATEKANMGTRSMLSHHVARD